MSDYHCEKCKDRGHTMDGDGTGCAQVYCECPIGNAFAAAWEGTDEEELEVIVESMRVFLLAAPPSSQEAPAAPRETKLTPEQVEAVLLGAGLDANEATERIMSLVRSYHPCDACGRLTKRPADPASGIILCGCAERGAPAARGLDDAGRGT